jgi:hypothetical protein
MPKLIILSEVVLRKQLSTRGGGIEIDLTRFGFKGQKMSAYQNYLGGGMLGAIANDCTINDWEEDKKLVSTSIELSKYFHSLTNPDSEWEGAEFEELQKRSVSAY